MSKHALTIAVLCLAAGGCGDSNDAATTATAPTESTTTAPTTTSAAPISVTVFRVRNGKLYADVEQVQGTRAVAAASLAALGLALPVSISGGTATVHRDQASPAEVAEIVYTLTQFPSVQRVDVAQQTGLDPR